MTMPAAAVFLAAPLAAVRVDFDMTVIYTAVLFCVLALVLEPWLFEPLLRVFELRNQRTEGARAEARALQERAGVLLRKVDVEVDRIRRTASQEREAVRAETAHLEATILAEARESAARIVEEGRQRVQAELERTRGSLDQEARRLGREIAAAALDREVR